MSTVICLGGGVESVPMIRRVKELGHQAIVVDGNPNAPAKDVADVFVHASCYHGEQAIERLNFVGVKFDGVLCCAVDAPVACAQIAQAFGLPGLSVRAAAYGVDKASQLVMLYGLKIPAFQEIYSEDELIGFSRSCASVVKPIDSRGGRGVVRLLPKVNPGWAYEQAQVQSPSGRVLAEEWLDGPQLSTESIVQYGRVLFTAIGLRNYDRLDDFAPYCIEDGFDEPYGDDVLLSEVYGVIEQAARALDWYQHGAGTVKGDLVIHDGQVYVIELACRLSGGFFSTHGHPLSYGVDFVGAAIRAALGERLSIPQPERLTYVSQRYIFPAEDEIGQVVMSIEDDSVPHFHTWNIKVGDVIKPVTAHPARWGQVIATGGTPEVALDEARNMAAWLYAGVTTA